MEEFIIEAIWINPNGIYYDGRKVLVVIIMEGMCENKC